MKADRELAVHWDRVSSELQALGESAQQIALKLNRVAPSFEEISEASNLLASIKDCVDAVKGARALMLVSVRRQSGRSRT